MKKITVTKLIKCVNDTPREDHTKLHYLYPSVPMIVSPLDYQQHLINDHAVASYRVLAMPADYKGDLDLPSEVSEEVRAQLGKSKEWRPTWDDFHTYLTLREEANLIVPEACLGSCEVTGHHLFRGFGSMTNINATHYAQLSAANKRKKEK